MGQNLINSKRGKIRLKITLIDKRIISQTGKAKKSKQEVLPSPKGKE